MILLRADSGTTIGSGHVVRCLSLAAAMRTLGETCVFVCADRSAETLIQKSGFRVICMNTNWRSWDAELPEFLALVQKLQPAWVVADSYSVTAHWMQAVRRQTKLAYLDDVNAFRYPVDVLVNYNIYASELDYEASYAGLDTKLLLGCGYTPLREEFCGLPARPVRRDVRDVLVSTGGADPNNLAAQLLKWAVQDANLHDIRFHFIVGALNPNLPELSALAENAQNIRLHCDVSRMSELMCACDIAISAAGCTLYELCACGVPTITYILADNQMQGAKAFSREGLMRNAGDSRSGTQTIVPAVAQAFQQLASDVNGRAKMAEAARRVVDGEGAKRLARVLLSIQ